MKVGIYLEALTGSVGQGEFTPGWLKAFDPEAFNGGGHVDITTNPSYALKFDSTSDCLRLWNMSPVCKPYREDGAPNRPLRAFSIVIRRFDDQE